MIGVCMRRRAWDATKGGRTLCLWVAQAAGAVALALTVGACGPAPRSAASPVLGKVVTLSLPSSNGELVSIPLADARMTVLNFFAPTCRPCSRELPALMAKRVELAEKGARLVLVALLAEAESTKDAQLALAGWGASSPFLVDREDVCRDELAMGGLPSTYILDSSGTVRWVSPVNASAEDVIAAVP